jgi:hypothetical protein
VNAPSERAQYSTEDQRRIREQWVAEATAHCPSCAVTMNSRPIGGGSFGLGYARRRVWLLCPRCHRSAIFDAARATRN